MTRNRLRIALGIMLSVVIAIGVLLVTSTSTSDCATVRSMIDHNNHFNDHIEAAALNGTQPRIDEYREWASQLGQLAEKVGDPALAENAHTMANLAEESVPIVEKYLKDDEIGAHYNSAPPQYIKDYSRIGREFDTTLATLDQKCPA